MLMFAMHFCGVYSTVSAADGADTSAVYGAQALYLAAVLILFRNLYPLASRLLINNMYADLYRIHYDHPPGL